MHVRKCIVGNRNPEIQPKHRFMLLAFPNRYALRNEANVPLTQPDATRQCQHE